MITVFGFGSLLSEASARATAPCLTGFRFVEVGGWKRIFNKVGIVWLQKGQSDGIRLSSCAARPDPSSTIVCSAFECTPAGFAELEEREHRYRWTEVEGISPGGTSRGLICAEFDDEGYRGKCGSPEEYHRRVGRYYAGRIWRDDILPFPAYLARCLDAARSAGPEIEANFLDTTFLGDGVTSIRTYLAADPEALPSSIRVAA